MCDRKISHSKDLKKEQEAQQLAVPMLNDSIESRKSLTRKNNSVETVGNEKENQDLLNKYNSLMEEFNSYREENIQYHSKLQEEIQKDKSQSEKFQKKLEKKYETLLSEERKAHQQKVKKLQEQFQRQRQTFQEIVLNKNKAIEELAQMLQQSEKQKTRIVQENTMNLLSIVRSQENCLENQKYSHVELMKMYQHLLEENNGLKKQLMRVSGSSGSGGGDGESSYIDKNRSVYLYSAVQNPNKLVSSLNHKKSTYENKNHSSNSKWQQYQNGNGNGNGDSNFLYTENSQYGVELNDAKKNQISIQNTLKSKSKGENVSSLRRRKSQERSYIGDGGGLSFVGDDQGEILGDGGRQKLQVAMSKGGKREVKVKPKGKKVVQGSTAGGNQSNNLNSKVTTKRK